MSGITRFLEEFSVIEDPRVEGLVTYPLNEILLVTLCGVLSGNQDWEEIECWGEHSLKWLKQFLPFENGIPKAQTFNRVFNAINSKTFRDCFENWVKNLGVCVLNKHVAIDGKTINGSKQRSDGTGAVHLLSAFVSEVGMVISQEKVAEKSNEITAIPGLLDRLALEGTVITIDAMGTQKEIVQKICDKKADYLLALKGNHRSLLEDVKLFFEENSEEAVWDDFEDTYSGHGRIEIRSCTATSDIKWLKECHNGWQNLKSIAMIKSLRINKKTGEQSSDTRYYISSLPAKAENIQRLARSHCSIENSLHWCLDVTFKEDSCRVRTNHGAENLAIIRKIALNMLRNSNEKASLKRKMLKAAWDTDYLNSLIAVNNL